MIVYENLQDELKRIDDFFSKLSVEELEKKLEKSGILELDKVNNFFNIFISSEIYYQEYRLSNNYYNEHTEYSKYSNEKEGTRCHQAIAA